MDWAEVVLIHLQRHHVYVTLTKGSVSLESKSTETLKAACCEDTAEREEETSLNILHVRNYRSILTHKHTQCSLTLHSCDIWLNRTVHQLWTQFLQQTNQSEWSAAVTVETSQEQSHHIQEHNQKIWWIMSQLSENKVRMWWEPADVKWLTRHRTRFRRLFTFLTLVRDSLYCLALSSDTGLWSDSGQNKEIHTFFRRSSNTDMATQNNNNCFCSYCSLFLGSLRESNREGSHETRWRFRRRGCDLLKLDGEQAEASPWCDLVFTTVLLKWSF